MLFTTTSHRLADFIFSLGNYCLQLSDRERIDVKLKITSDLMFVNQMKYNFPIFSGFVLSFHIDFFPKTTNMTRESASVVIVVVKYVDPAVMILFSSLTVEIHLAHTLQGKDPLRSSDHRKTKPSTRREELEDEATLSKGRRKQSDLLIESQSPQIQPGSGGQKVKQKNRRIGTKLTITITDGR
ncbi:hypothetical protein Bca4012_078090 [Brassica carinata]